MAAVKPAVQRIKYLLTGGEYRATPDTISSGYAGIMSYAMPIVTGGGGVRYVTNESSTATTNRHIRAAHQAMVELGYVEDGPTFDGGCYYDSDVCEWTRYIMKPLAE